MAWSIVLDLVNIFFSSCIGSMAKLCGAWVKCELIDCNNTEHPSNEHGISMADWEIDMEP